LKEIYPVQGIHPLTIILQKWAGDDKAEEQQLEFEALAEQEICYRLSQENNSKASLKVMAFNK